MPSRLLAGLLFAMAASPLVTLFAADVLPTSGKAVGFIRDDTPGFWLVLAQDFTPVDAKFFEGDEAKGYRGCVFEGPPGTRYMAIKIEQGRPKTFPVILSGAVPLPPVTPDPPIVPPGPEVPPVIPPVVAGPRTLLIIRESSEDTPATSRLIVNLQAGAGHTYIKSKGHACLILDADAKTASGQPDPKVAAWIAAVGIQPPFLAVLDAKGKVLARATLQQTATAEEVLAILRSYE